MATNKPTCFVISPIGADGSDTRVQADDFLELLIEPTLQKFNFEVIRADRIARPSIITNDIVQLVQQSELCIIDVTGGNPNVFYECGRRHESGKPFLQLVRKGEEGKLPFDVAGIRTIPYDLSSPRSVLTTQNLLQEFIEQIISTGFGNINKGESLGSIAQTLERVERKLDRHLEAKSTILPSGGGGSNDAEDIIGSILKPVKKQFLESLASGNVERAIGMFPRLRQSTSEGEYLGLIGLLASMGEPRALSVLETSFEDMLGREKVDDDVVKVVIEMIKNYYGNTGRASEGVDYLTQMLERVQPSPHFASDLKGFLANKVGMCAWLADRYHDCIKYTKIAISYCPNEPSYVYNLSLAFKELDMAEDFKATVAKLKTMEDLDDDHKRLVQSNQ